MADTERRARLSRAGRCRALAHFGIERMLEKTEHVFRHVRTAH